MSTYNNIYAQQIHKMLTPLIGDTIAQGALRWQCNKLGISEEDLRRDHLVVLAEGIRRGLVMFIGTDEAKRVAERIATGHL